MNESAREKEAVLAVFAGLVRPLMRVAFEYGISASEIAAVVRRAYIQALEARFLDQQRTATDARLAVVAGLARSDVAALREAVRAGAPHSLPRAVNINQITNLLTVWHTHPGFSGAYGLAMELDVVPTAGSPRRSFSELVAAACPGAITVRCLSRAYVQKGADVRRIERMGRFLAAITGNFVHNLLRVNPEPIYFERAVISEELLSEAGRDKFLALSGERGQELLTELDTFLTRLATTEANTSGKRYGVGIYFFDAPPAQTTKEQTSEPADDEPNRKASPKVEEIDVLAGLGRQK